MIAHRSRRGLRSRRHTNTKPESKNPKRITSTIDRSLFFSSSGGSPNSENLVIVGKVGLSHTEEDNDDNVSLAVPPLFGMRGVRSFFLGMRGVRSFEKNRILFERSMMVV